MLQKFWGKSAQKRRLEKAKGINIIGIQAGRCVLANPSRDCHPKCFRNRTKIARYQSEKAYSSFLFSLSRSMCILRFGKQAAFYLDHVHGLNDASCAHARQTSVQKRLDGTPHRYWHLRLFWSGRHLGLSHVPLSLSLLLNTLPTSLSICVSVWIVCWLVRSL